MATITNKYGFKKPEQNDFYSVEDQNRNWDLAEGAISKLNSDLSRNSVNLNLNGGESRNLYFSSQLSRLPITFFGQSGSGLMFAFMIAFDSGSVGSITTADKTIIIDNTYVSNIIVALAKETSGYRLKIENNTAAGQAISIVFGGNTMIAG